MKHLKKRSYYNYFLVAFLAKFSISLAFSSGFKEQLFLPFITHFIKNAGNPWDHFFLIGSEAAFPYHPFMLALFSLSYSPVILGNWDHILISNAFFKLPILCADILITVLLIKQFPNKLREILVYYTLSPVILYASYMHSQLDLVPTALLVASLFFLLRERSLSGGIFFGLAIATKLHILLAAPIVLLYFYRKKETPPVLKFVTSTTLVYLTFTLPFMFSTGFQKMVLFNSKQNLLFDLTFPIGQNQFLITLGLLLLIYFKFALYKKTNHDLLYSYIGILFSIVVLTLLPRPGWYIWIIPFLSMFLIKSRHISSEIRYLYWCLNSLYLLFFLFFHQTEIPDLLFLDQLVSLKYLNGNAPNIIFTLLEILLFMLIFSMYRFGVKSNQVYKHTNNTVIGIGGDSGSGKSVLLKDIQALSPSTFLELEADGAHKWERNHKNWDTMTHCDPKANNLHELAEQIICLKQGKASSFRFYDHYSGTFTPPITIAPKEFILISGLHPFYLPMMRKAVDIRIFMDTDEALRKDWKIKRDVNKRNKNIHSVLLSLKQRQKDSEKHIQTQRKFCDIIFKFFKKNKYILLQITCKADIRITPLIEEARQQGCLDSWDYLDDLNYVTLTLNRTLPETSLDFLVEKNIENLSELIPSPIQWAPGFRGITQFMVLYFISQSKRQ